VLLALAPVRDALYTVDLMEPAQALAIAPNEWPSVQNVEIILDPSGVIDE
jgi:hypothetical protein